MKKRAVKVKSPKHLCKVQYKVKEVLNSNKYNIFGYHSKSFFLRY